MTYKPKGHIADPEDMEADEYPGKSFSTFTGMIRSSCMALEEIAQRRPVLNQVGSSCTGHAARYVLEIRLDVLYGPNAVGPISPMGIYTGGRMVGGYADVDGGARPKDVVTFMQEAGIFSEERWSSTRENLDKELPVDTIKAGADARVTGWAKILKNARLTSLCTALSDRRPFMCALHVDEAMESDEVFVIRAFRGKDLGSHMIAIHGYEADDKDPFGIRFRGKGSWGDGYKDGGYFWMGAERVLQGTDFYVLDAAPSVLT